MPYFSKIFKKKQSYFTEIILGFKINNNFRFGNNGCDGGEDFRAYQWMMKHGGIPSEEEYGPYLGQVSFIFST